MTGSRHGAIARGQRGADQGAHAASPGAQAAAPSGGRRPDSRPAPAARRA